MFGETLKNLRKKRKMTQRQLADMLYVDCSSVTKWETGKANPDFKKLQQIAEIFGVSIDTLLGRHKHKSNNILQELRAEKGVPQYVVAEYLGITKQSYSLYELGKRNPDNEMLYNISEYFNVSLDYLLGKSKIKNPEILGNAFKIPVLGSVRAGIPISAIEEILDYEEISQDIAQQGEHFALRIKGDSMEPKFSEGDVVIIRQQNDVDSGDIAIVLINGDEATVKKIKKQEDGITLIPSNPAYDIKFYNNNEIETLPVQIIGKIVELRAKF